MEKNGSWEVRAKQGKSLKPMSVQEFLVMISSADKDHLESPHTNPAQQTPVLISVTESRGRETVSL